MFRIEQDKKHDTALIKHKIQYIARKEKECHKPSQPLKANQHSKNISLPHVVLPYNQNQKVRKSQQMATIMETANEDRQGLDMKQQKYQIERQHAAKNIFAKSQMRQYGLDIGSPQYNGQKMVRYSVIGTEQEYQNGKKQLEQTSSRESSTSQKSQVSNKSVISQLKNGQFKSRISCYDQSRLQNYKKVGQVYKKKQKQKLQKSTQKQLMENIRRVESSMYESQQSLQQYQQKCQQQYQQQYHKVYSVQDQQQLCKDGRVLIRHDMMQQTWQKYRKKLVINSGKDYSVMDGQNKHREKMEIETIIDRKNRKRGRMADWSGQLRKYENKERNDDYELEIVRVDWPYRQSNTTINRIDNSNRIDSYNSISNIGQQYYMNDGNNNSRTRWGY